MDRISQLSDDLLLKMLSWVPTKDVVATGLLSKRWRSLWMLVPELKYDDRHHTGDYKNFSQFVYRSLLSNKAPVLDYLDLALGSDCPEIDFRLWFDIAISRRVRKLDIYIHSGNSVCLPSSLYTSDTLEILILTHYVLLDVPSSVCLPSLKYLRLDHVDYVDSASLPSLLSGCPNLKELSVERYDKDLTMDTTIVVPSLQRLSMIDQNSKTLGRYVIDAPSLKYLSITDDVHHSFRQIKEMPELVKAHVEITDGFTQKLLKALTSVQHLSLCLSPLQIMYHPSSDIIFSQLVHLNFYTFAEGWWDVLTYMLQASHKLQSLKLIDKYDSGLVCGKEVPAGWKPPSSVPASLLFSLEAFEWVGYKGRQGDREMATYVLKNAPCLKTATFSPESTDVGEKYQMHKDLASVPTASTSSQLLFD